MIQKIAMSAIMLAPVVALLLIFAVETGKDILAHVAVLYFSLLVMFFIVLGFTIIWRG